VTRTTVWFVSVVKLMHIASRQFPGQLQYQAIW